MDCFQCIEGRRSCRAFIPKEVEKNLMEKILKVANRSPSFMNTQPWEVFVVAGERKNILAKRLLEQASSGIPYSPDLPFPKEWPEALERRSKNHRLRRFEALGIDPEDKEKVRESFLSNFQFFDAPCVLFVGMDKSLSPWSVFDLGLFVHGLLLALHAEGLGGCPQAMPTAYSEIIREKLETPDSTQIVLAISLGYPDQSAEVNQYISTRRELDEFTRWYGF
jgi:nitroreductase